jgi:hypothetical protein
MLWANSFYYLVDQLDSPKAILLKRVRRAIPEGEEADGSVNRGSITIKAKRDMTDQVRMACDIVGATFRTQVKKSDIYH